MIDTPRTQRQPLSRTARTRHRHQHRGDGSCCHDAVDLN